MNYIYPKDRDELRAWLQEHAATEKEVFVRCIRRQHDEIISYLDVVEEALCFGWIDSVTRSDPESDGYFQRLSPRRKNSFWTELNKERCRRLIKLGLMTPAGKKVLPSLAKNSFRIEPWVLDVLKADKQAWRNHRHFPPLYVRVRIYNIQWNYKRNMKDRALAMLDKYVKAAHDGKMIGDWNDGGRLLDY